MLRALLLLLLSIGSSHAASDDRVLVFCGTGQRSVGAGDNIKRFPQAKLSRMRSTLAAKGRAEQLLIDSGIGYTIIRNGIWHAVDDSLDVPPQYR